MPFSAVGINAVTAGSALVRATSRKGSGRLNAAHGTGTQSVLPPPPNAFGCRSPKRSCHFSIFWSQPRHLARALVAGSIRCGMASIIGLGGTAPTIPLASARGAPYGLHVLSTPGMRAYDGAPREAGTL